MPHLVQPSDLLVLVLPFAGQRAVLRSQLFRFFLRFAHLGADVIRRHLRQASRRETVSAQVK